MQIISIKQPFAEAIINGEKKVENRTWKTDYRGILAIHSSKAMDSGFYKSREYGRLTRKNQGLYDKQNLTLGAIIGICRLVTVTENSKASWARPGNYHWILEDGRRLEKPVAYTGALGLRRLTASMERKILKNATINSWADALQTYDFPL